MTSAINNADHSMVPVCCQPQSARKPRCVCQACHDPHHLCRHERNWDQKRKEKMEGITTYEAHYCVERPFKPPPDIMRPPPHSNLLCGNMDQDTTYQAHYKTPVAETTDTYHAKKLRHEPVKPKMEKKSQYMFDYGSQMSEFEKALLYWRRRNEEEWLAFQKKTYSPLSKMARPPRPYDYSKCDNYTAIGPLYLPTAMIREREKELEVKLPKYHSDGAVNSYTTGTTVKDDYRLNADARHVTCCRPETSYHPDLLHTCIVCHDDKNHKQCPLWMYGKPPVPLKDKPYIGPTPAIRECSTYESSYTSPALHSFLIPDAPCSRKCPPPPEPPCPRLSRNLPIPVGFERCH